MGLRRVQCCLRTAGQYGPEENVGLPEYSRTIWASAECNAAWALPDNMGLMGVQGFLSTARQYGPHESTSLPEYCRTKWAECNAAHDNMGLRRVQGCLSNAGRFGPQQSAMLPENCKNIWASCYCKAAWVLQDNMGLSRVQDCLITAGHPNIIELFLAIVAYCHSNLGQHINKYGFSVPGIELIYPKTWYSSELGQTNF